VTQVADVAYEVTNPRFPAAVESDPLNIFTVYLTTQSFKAWPIPKVLSWLNLELSFICRRRCTKPLAPLNSESENTLHIPGHLNFQNVMVIRSWILNPTCNLKLRGANVIMQGSGREGDKVSNKELSPPFQLAYSFSLNPRRLLVSLRIPSSTRNKQ